MTIRLVDKKCTYCLKNFQVEYKRRAQGYCSISCGRNGKSNRVNNWLVETGRKEEADDAQDFLVTREHRRVLLGTEYEEGFIL